MLKQALAGLDFAALEAFSAAEFTRGGCLDSQHISLPLTPYFLQPSSVAGLGKNSGFVSRTGFNRYGGPTINVESYDDNVENGPAVVASLWDFGRYAEEARRLRGGASGKDFDVTDEMLFDIFGNFDLDHLSALFAGETNES